MPHTEFNEGSRMAVCTLPVLFLSRTIWIHVSHSYAKRSIKPIRLPLKCSCQRRIVLQLRKVFA